jgi:hypothetical protein
MTTITIEPHATEVVVPVKSPEELQQQAEQDGTLRVWHEFSWWFPWYRIHYVSVVSGVAEYDMGNSPLPFADTFSCVTALFERVESFLPRVLVSIVTGIATADFSALLASSLSGPLGFFIPLALSLGFKFGALYLNWNSIEGLMSAYIGSLVSTLLGLIKDKFRIIPEIIDLVLGFTTLAQVGWGKLYRMVSLPVNMIYQSIVLDRIVALQTAG